LAQKIRPNRLAIAPTWHRFYVSDRERTAASAMTGATDRDIVAGMKRFLFVNEPLGARPGR
jgi:hypothetical protein